MYVSSVNVMTLSGDKLIIFTGRDQQGAIIRLKTKMVRMGMHRMGRMGRMGIKISLPDVLFMDREFEHAPDLHLLTFTSQSALTDFLAVSNLVAQLRPY